MLKAKLTSLLGMISAAAITVGSLAAVPAFSIRADAASQPAYNSKWTAEIPFLTLLKSSLLKGQTDSNGIYEQLKQAIQFKVISEADLAQLKNEGYRIPTAALQQLYAEGWISAAAYTMLTGNTYTIAQFRDVFDANYYVSANPAISAAVQNGTLPSDEASLFLNYLACGIPAGLSASPNFSFSYFEKAYPVVAKDLNYDKLGEITFYVTYKDSLNLKGNG